MCTSSRHGKVHGFGHASPKHQSKFMGLAMPLLYILGDDFTETDFILILIQFDAKIFLIKRSGPNCLVSLNIYA
jgi:hypothetical protein